MFRGNVDDNGEDDGSELKFIQDRIDLAEVHLGNICSALASYSRKVAILRDKGDETAKTMRDYANAETLNRSLHLGLNRFSECLTAIEDHRQASIDRLDTKVVGQLGPYESNCKAVKDDVKKALKARTRQNDRKQLLKRAKDRTPCNRQEVAETELTKATVEATQTMQKLETLMDTFEQNKLKDLKQVLLDFTVVELQFHAKALELYTKAYNHIKEIDEEEDLQEFRNRLKTCCTSSWNPGTSQLDLVRSISERFRSALPSSLQRQPPTVAFESKESSSMQSLVGKLEAITSQKDEESSTTGSSDDEIEEEEEDDDESDEPEIEFLDSTHRIQVRSKT